MAWRLLMEMSGTTLPTPRVRILYTGSGLEVGGQIPGSILPIREPVCQESVGFQNSCHFPLRFVMGSPGGGRTEPLKDLIHQGEALRSVDAVTEHPVDIRLRARRRTRPGGPVQRPCE